MNRGSMLNNSSPFQRMSFETTINFIKSSAMRGEFDKLASPSANLVVGQPIHHGTGSFDIVTPLSLDPNPSKQEI